MMKRPMAQSVMTKIALLFALLSLCGIFLVSLVKLTQLGL